MFRIFITADVAKEAKEILEKEFIVDIQPNMKEEELVKVIGDYDAIITRSQTKVTKKVIDAAKNLKVIGRAGVGIDGIDIKEATQKGITVVNTPESNTIAACEHTIALMLSMTRHIPQAHQSIMEGRWDRKSFTGIQLLNKTVGIIGVGRVGSNVAKRLQAFNMKTIGYDPYIPLERGKQLGVELPGKVAVKVHSGEDGNQNFLRPEFMKPVIDAVHGTVVECNTAYDGARNTTEKRASSPHVRPQLFGLCHGRHSTMIRAPSTPHAWVRSSAASAWAVSV